MGKELREEPFGNIEGYDNDSGYLAMLDNMARDEIARQKEVEERQNAEDEALRDPKIQEILADLSENSSNDFDFGM